MRLAAGLSLIGGCLVGLGGAPALAQAWRAAAATSPLDVPYLAQSWLLCGGAAVAMVERWWGRRGVYAEEFADLVRPAEGGIFTTELVARTRARGWRTRLVPATSDAVRRELAARVPVIALIEVARGRYHYVVVIGWDDQQVVFHDPAGSPGRRLREAEFLERWSAAKRWAMVLEPGADLPAEAAGTPRPQSGGPDGGAGPPTPCSPLMDRALDHAEEGALDDAAHLLDQARSRCPNDPVIRRELGGVRFRQQRHAEAAALAAAYVREVPADPLGWELLASARYLTGDRQGALNAWNRVGKPTIDLVRIDGGRNIRFPPMAGALALTHGSALTPRRLELARRRAADLPAVARAAVEYRPVGEGRVEVTATVIERSGFQPTRWTTGVPLALRAVAHDDLRLSLRSPSKGGELWRAEWRWTPARPRLSLGVEAPARVGLPGIVTLETRWERHRTAPGDPSAAAVDEHRRVTELGFGAWVHPAIRPSVASRLEQWSSERRYVTVAGEVEVRALRDRLGAFVALDHGIARSRHPGFQRVAIDLAGATARGFTRTVWSGRLGGVWLSDGAPVGAWPVAGAESWAIPLRAEPIGSGGVSGHLTGRRVLHGGVAVDHPLHRAGPFVLGVGGFLDAAEIRSALGGQSGGRFFLDVGGGVRVGLGGGDLGVLRIDLARGAVPDRRTTLRVGMEPVWPLDRLRRR